ncbi:hypothetical protein RvY_01222 [Ramazzottius varieornatus]|uniref:Selenoprotein S n=1 Tax=Ramazzottius varieornatus TaxID=947166 RepID=A0A1D1UFI7_RAMVA|nr:hypothetical protein RvY_01222 [Ramazzottius varieornatus]
MHGVNGEGSFSSVWESFLSVLSSYGWILASILFAYFLLKDKVLVWRASLGKSEDGEAAPESERQLLLEKQREARRNQQERLDALSHAHAERIKIAEEEKRRQRLAELEEKTVNGGRRLGSNLHYVESGDSATASTSKKPSGPRLRNNDYNPLTGDCGGSRPRPQGRNSSNKRG